jgi:hypothetical protein
MKGNVMVTEASGAVKRTATSTLIVIWYTLYLTTMT